MQTFTFGILGNPGLRAAFTMAIVFASMSAAFPATALPAQGWVAANAVALPKPKIAEIVPRRYVALPAGTQQLGGHLSERFTTNLEGRLLHVDESGLLDGFRQRPGKHAWIGEHIGKFLDAGTRVYRYNKDARLKALMDRMVKELLATQEADGYMGTYTAAEKWTSWDVWSHKYNLMGLLAYYQTTGDEASLSAAVRIGNLLDNTFGPKKKDLIKAGTHVGMAATSVLGPMVDLYRATGDARYLAFCKYILKAYEQPNGPSIVSTLAKTGSVHKTANAKAYEMLSNLIGLVKLYEVTADKVLLDTATIAWKDITENRLYITGSTSSKEHFQEAHVLPGEIKNDIAETCVTVNWLELNVELLSLSGEAKFADQIEKTVFNHLLAAQDAKNGNFSYYTPLNGRKPFTPGINCCVSSGPRGISMLPELAWGQLDGSPAVTLYTAGKAKQTVATTDGPVELELTVKTDFPESGNVTIELKNSRGGTFPLYLRVPPWVTSFTVGGETQPGTPGTFMRIERNWKTKNKLQVKMDLPVRVVQGGPSYPGRVAVIRGPQVLAMEFAEGEPNPAPALREFVALQGPLENLPLTFLPKHHGLAFSAPAFVLERLEEGAKATKRNITLVPYADARSPVLWLLKQDFAREQLAARTAREAARPHLLVPATKTEPVIDGTPDESVFKNTTAIAKQAGTGRPRSKANFDVSWDKTNLYVAAWVVDPTPEKRLELDSTDSIFVALSRKGYEAPLRDNDVYAQVRFKGDPSTAGIRHASATTANGYTIEMAIPWTILKTKPQAGNSFGFEIRNRDQGLREVEDDGQWQWADAAADLEIAGVLDLAP